MIDEPDGTQGRKTDFHCQHCGPLQDRLASLQVELGRLRQEFRRGQIIAQVIGELHRLANRQAAIGELGELMVDLLVEALAVDSAALLKWDGLRGRFVIVHGRSLAPDWELALPPSEVPDGCNSDRCQQAPFRFVELLHQTTALQRWIWVCHRRAGLALLLGDALDSGLNRGRFDADDHRIAETALAVYVTLHHLDRTETALKYSETKYQALFDGATDALAVLDPDSGLILDSNRQAHEIFGRGAGIGRRRRALEHFLFDAAGDARDSLADQRARALAGETVPAEYQFRSAANQSSWIELHFKTVEIEGRTRLLAVLRDISERKQVEARLQYHALHDALTGLPNRAMILGRLQELLDSRYPRYERSALLLLDINRFKVINDSLGHDIGDRMLAMIGQRLQSCLRAGDIVARLGGDEFLLLLAELRQPGDAMICAERAHQSLSDSFYIGDHEIHATASIGIALNQGDRQRAEDMLRDADIALHQAKARGKDQPYVLFDSAMYDQMVRLMQLERDLRRALEQREFEVFYQPIINLATGALKGFEALVRWRHPQRGLVSPADFIPVAEETMLIVPLGWEVLADACRRLATWTRCYPERMPITICVNLSSRQLLDSGLFEDIRRLLAETGCDPALLELEVTESVLIENSDTARMLLNSLRDLSIRLSLDDFGTGYSSLSYLHQFPFDTIKIDRTFIQTMDQSDGRLEIVRAIIALARALGKNVVAEGLETLEQVDLLTGLGCDFGQGYYFARPMNAVAAESFLTKARVLSAAERSAGWAAAVAPKSDRAALN
ncbi:MAG: EAL domain-containing protein [Candidatus Competibacteraceae bacterium]|nr:EAL domain-containing protein [Candidatus Competibacteraceae bacterium]MBK9950023.1 EAL domain-containing protein [Candidatus Competibacteraceae bacterium]